MRKSMQMARLAVLAILAVSLSGCSYNTFTTQEEAIKGAWGEVQNQIQRRSDLIPNLVESVKAYAAHEKGVFEEVAEARAKSIDAESVGEAVDA